MKESDIKTRLIDYLLKWKASNAPYAIASEVEFSAGKRRADLVEIGSECVAYEIKSEYDNLNRLPSQLVDYTSTFEMVYIVTAKRHLNLIKQIIPRSIGIIQLDDGVLLRVRSAQKRVALKKRALADLISREKLLNIKELRAYRGERMDVAQLRDKLCKVMHLSEIKCIAYQSLYERSLTKFQKFMRQRGDVTHTEDLIMLTEQPDELFFKSAI